jgi:6-phosphofructokinase 1
MTGVCKIPLILDASRKIKRPLIMTGGGDCSGLNAAIRAVVKTFAHFGINEVIAAKDGYEGLWRNSFKGLDYDSVANVINTAGTILGSNNKFNPFKLKVDGSERDVSETCLEHLKEKGIDAAVIIGGDGTMTIASRFLEKFEQEGIDIPIIGIPKTIDNDIIGTDITIGFDSAVRQLVRMIDDVRSTAESHHRVMVIEAMGRYSGWLALYAGVAGGADIILIPEMPYNLDKICEVVKKRAKKGRKYTIIVVAEGAKEKGGDRVISRIISDSPDPIRLGGIAEKLCSEIEAKTKLSCRHLVPGHTQRGGAPTAFDIDLATLIGVTAVSMLMRGHRDKLLVVKQGKIQPASISRAADKNRKVGKNHPMISAALAVGTSFGV